MEKKNGSWVVRTLVGFLFIIILTSITTLAGYVRANDDKSRARDVKLDEKFHEAVLEQQKQNEDIKVSLGKIVTTLEFIKNGR